MYLMRNAGSGLLAAMLALPAGAAGTGQAPGAAAEQAAAGFDTPAAPAVLEHARGGSDGDQGSAVASARLGGTVGGNTAVNVNTGTNVIQGGSFANMSGIPIVVQNSGANVLIQNATVINLQFN